MEEPKVPAGVEAGEPAETETVPARIAQKLKQLPDKPGVYLMHDEWQHIIYVGKARSLKQRVRSYFQAARDHSAKTRALVANIADLEYILTDSEVEALILECNLIKEYRPKYNISLRDDKTYPYLRVTMSEDFPRVFITRTKIRDGSRYFGPYTNVGAVRETLEVLKSVFPLRSCHKKGFTPGGRPCLNAHIKRCLAPCSGQVDPAVYQTMIQQVLLFLEGRQDDLVRSLKAEMEQASGNLEFERAAQLRDRLRAIEQVAARQKIVADDQGDADVFAIALAAGEAVVQVFFVRAGKLVGRENFVVKNPQELPADELLNEFLKQYYTVAEVIPPTLLLPVEIGESRLISQWLRERRGGRLELRMPKRGAKRELVEMATRNAQEALELRRQEKEVQRREVEEALVELRDELDLADLPRRIECFDISNLQGSESVASMAVAVNGELRNKEYRRFQVKTVIGPNDFASLQEVVGRRFQRGLKEQAQVEAGQLAPAQAKFAQFPDLLIIDGGKGQLSAVREVMAQLGVAGIPTFGLAKEFEYLFGEERPEPIILSRSSPALHLLQRLRDEAHRFAISYHREQRSKRTLRSALDDIAGIGPARRQALLKHFGSVQKIREASVAELKEARGMTQAAAREVYDFFHPSQE